jgi:hypothetical protein
MNAIYPFPKEPAPQWVARSIIMCQFFKCKEMQWLPWVFMSAKSSPQAIRSGNRGKPYGALELRHCLAAAG